jgi:hypothetical protein
VIELTYCERSLPNKPYDDADDEEDNGEGCYGGNGKKDKLRIFLLKS